MISNEKVDALHMTPAIARLPTAGRLPDQEHIPEGARDWKLARLGNIVGSWTSRRVR